VFDAASNHKYDTGDYAHVDAMFGGDKALVHLIRRAAQFGIRVILDGVFNHTGSDSIYFNREGHYDSVGAYQSPESTFAPWYNFREYPDEYECWWGIRTLPRVNCDESSYREYLLGENGIVRKWMDCGVAGWRLDVADELSDGFLNAFRSAVRRRTGDAVIYGEVWENAATKISYGKRRKYLQGQQLDSVMNYPLRDAVIRYIRDGNTEVFRSYVQTVCRQYPRESSDLLMNILGTHDTARILTELGGESPEGKSPAELARMKMSENKRSHAIRMLKLAYRLITVMPGIPCIFYGDEAGMEGYGDPFCRRPFPWGSEDRELTEFYRKIGQLRRAQPVLRDGQLKVVHLTAETAAVLRTNGRDPSLLLLLNRSAHPVVFHLSIPMCDSKGKKYGNKIQVAAMDGFFCCPERENLLVDEIICSE